MFGWGEDTTPVYEGDLSTLVASVLDKDEHAALLEAAAAGEQYQPGRQVSTQYIDRILSEEVEKQFGDPKRSFVELVTNSIDARPEDAEEYKVRLTTLGDRFAVRDRGVSMDLEDVVTTLLVPFHSEKDPAEDIGRFGVGFFSNLSVPVENPDDGRITVEIDTGEYAHSVEFWNDGDGVEDLQVRIAPDDPSRRGTDVIIDGVEADMGEVKSYLNEYLGNIDPAQADIRYGLLSRRLNTLPDGETYRGTAAIPLGDRTAELPVRATVNTAAQGDDAGIFSYAAGVLVDKQSRDRGAIHVNLPGAVELVEGRNAFNRKSSRYTAAVDGAYDLIIDNLANETDTRTLRQLLPALESATGHTMSQDRITAAATELFSGEVFVLPTSDAVFRGMGEYELAGRFFGNELNDRVVPAASDTEARFWQDVTGDSEDLIEQYVTETETATIEELAAADNDIYNLERLAEYRRDTEVQLSQVDTEKPGVSAFFAPGRNPDGPVYLREDHPYLELPDHQPSSYSLVTSYFQAMGERENEIEHTLSRRGRHR